MNARALEVEHYLALFPHAGPHTPESIRAAAHPNLIAKPLDGVVLHVNHPFLEWDQRVVGDLYVLRT